MKTNTAHLKDKCALYIEYILLEDVPLVILRNAQVPLPVTKSQQQLALKHLFAGLKAEWEKNKVFINPDSCFKSKCVFVE